MNPSPSLRPPSSRFAGRGQGEGILGTMHHLGGWCLQRSLSPWKRLGWRFALPICANLGLFRKKWLWLESIHGICCVQEQVHTAYQFTGLVGACLLAATLCCVADDQIRVYTVPKELPPTQLSPFPAQMAAGSQDIPFNAATVHWTLPAGWKENSPTPPRLASLAITGEKGGQAEVAITSFQGSVGTELINVNRWRGELSLEPVESSNVASVPVTVDSSEGKLYDIAGKSARTVVAEIPRNGSSWFIKLRGDNATVAAAKPAFLEFLKSVHFGGEDGATAGADPHAGLGLQGAPAAPSPASDGPKWNVPPQWVETPPRAMVFKGFEVAGEAGAKADISISFFPGDVGGVLANVNRWRGQMAQPPIDAGQLDGVTESVATLGGSGTMVDFMGTDAKTSQPARLVGVIVPHGENTWFYKLMGDAKVVKGQKDSFVQFVKTVQYP